MTTLFLIRHAANDFVKDGKLAGWLPNVHINGEGHQQAEQMATRMAKVKLDAIYSSPLERAIETAEYLARPRGLVIRQCEGLGEHRVGAWEDQKIQDLEKTDEWRMYQFYSSGTRPPGGETGRETQMRAVGEIEAICAAHPDGAVAIVSHSDPIKMIVSHYAGIHLDLFQRLIISPASVTVLWLGPHGPRLVRLNDSGPLEELKPPTGQQQPAEGSNEQEEKKEEENAGRNL
jgi:probable phosphomutase (TIGR03848 family)